ncbi:UPAR/Ly6 domain-containing protein bou-like isoform X2 [Argopecten irradians]|uniref:UPAR/Ly6 domain-containing protein bou-like isoform X1 n=1 Tax=Argopecten irradians TaxID=31199 RepID=UPI003724216A
MNRSWTYIVPICILFGCKHVLAIDCYVCSSLQHGNPDCEDKFDQNLKTAVFIARKCDFGFFKATHCIKLKGTREDGTSILVRQCSNEDWGSHCGDIKYEIGDSSEMVYGCLETCNFDGCNSSNHFTVNNICVMGILGLSFLVRKWLL